MPSARPFDLPKIGQTPSDLIIELKDLNERLGALEQEEDEMASSELRAKLAPMAAGLVEHKWMLHRDKTVRLMIACCLSQVLRLYAPDPPFSGESLSRVFSLFVQQLKGLSEPGGTYFSHYFGLLEGLATVKSVVLVWEVPEDEGRDVILTDLFKTGLALVHPKLGQPVRVYLLELLEAVIGECPPNASLPDQAITLLLGGLKEDGFISEFTNDLIQLSSEQFSPMLARHFNDVLLSHATAPAMDQIRIIHGQIASIKSIDALSQVILQIGQELLMEESEMRTLAIQTLAAIFGQAKHGRPFNSVWTAWLNRRHDRVPGVRAHWISHAARLLGLIADSGSLEDLSKALGERLLDPEERIRERVLFSLGEIERLESIPKNLLSEVATRCLDKKEDVRVSALTILCSLLRRLDMGEGKSQSQVSLEINGLVSKWAFLPRALFGLLFTDDKDTRILFEYFLEHSCLTTLGQTELLPVGTQALRWVWMWASLDEQGRMAFTRWIKGKAHFVKLTQAFLQLAGTCMMESRQMLIVMQHLCDRFRAPQQAQATLTALAGNEELRSLFLTLTNPNTPLEVARKALLSVGNINDPSMKGFILQFLANRASWVSASRELVTELLALTSVDPSVPRLIELIITELPALGANHGDFLLNACIESDYEVVRLKAFYQFIRSSTTLISAASLPDVSEFKAALEHLMETSDCRHQVKYAARILLSLSPDLVVTLVESAASDTAHPDAMIKLRAWQCLLVLGQEKPALLPPYLEELLLEYEVILSDLSDVDAGLLKVSTTFWSAALSQLTAAPLMTAHDRPYSEEISESILKAMPSVATQEVLSTMLKTVLILSGNTATLSYLLERPALLQSLGGASENTISKVAHLVASRRVKPLVLLPILMKSNKESQSKLKSLFQQALHSWLQTVDSNDEGETEHLIDTSSIKCIEDHLVPLIVLLAGSSFEVQECRLILSFFFDIVLNQENLSYLFALAVETKRYRIAAYLKDHASDKSMYICSEIAQNLLRLKATFLHTSLEAFPLPLRVTDTALSPLEPELASKNLARSYLAKMNAKRANSVIARKKFGTGTLKKTTTANPASVASSSSSSSPRRRNPARNVKLPAGTLEALLSDQLEEDTEDEHGILSDEIEDDSDDAEENKPDLGSNISESLPVKRSARLAHPMEFSIDMN